MPSASKFNSLLSKNYKEDFKMSFLEALLDGRSASERKKKTMCAVAIAITALLLVAAIITFAICQIAVNTSNNSDNEKDTKEDIVDIGETVVKELSDTAIYSGNLLTLNSTARYKGEADVVKLQDRSDRPKTETGDNSYTVLPATRNNFYATEATATALNKMLKAFYEAKKDDNIFISGAYDISEAGTQEAVFSSGEAIELSYFHDYASNGINDQRSISGVDIYKWIYANAHKYGFVAISSSSNIFRYVGVTHATAVKNKGLSLDNYLKQLKTATVDAPMQLDASGSYIAYYCPINDVKIPKNYSYEISGNNVDGVFITVNVSKASSSNLE